MCTGSPQSPQVSSFAAGISMRELDPPPTDLPACAVIGAGRMGTVMAAGLHAGSPLKRDEPVPARVDVVLLCVPAGPIAAAARTRPGGPGAGPSRGAPPPG